MAFVVSGLYGRDDEIRVFEQCVTRVQNGESESLIIEGEPGIGKSRLVAELLAQGRVQGWPVFISRSAELDVDQPFLPIGSALNELIADLTENNSLPQVPSELALGAELLRSPTSSNIESEGAERITTMISEGVHELSRMSPVVVIFEDVHWIDEASARLLWRIARARRSSNVLVVVTARHSNRAVLQSLRRSLETHGAITIKLAALPPEQAAAHAQELVGPGSVPDAALLNDAGGNPLFVTELMRGSVHVSNNGAPPSDSPIPESLRRLVHGRLAELPVESYEMLFDAALLGQQINVTDLCTVSSHDASYVRQRLIPAIENRMIVEGDNHLRFQHAIVQSIVAQSHSGLIRRERHGHIAARFAEVQAPATRVAEHLWLCQPDPAPASLGSSTDWMRRAAESVKPFSLASALVWMERAFQTSGTLSEKRDAQLEIAALNVMTGNLREAQELCDSIETDGATSEQLLSFHVTQASIASKQGAAKYSAATEHLDRALATMPAEEQRAAEVLGFKAVLSVFAGELERAEEEAEQAISIPLVAADQSVRSSAHEAKGLVALLRGDIANAQYQTELATNGFTYERKLCTALMMPHFSRAFVLLSTHPIQQVISVLNAGYRICDRAGHQLARAHLEPLTAVAHFLSGDLATAGRISDAFLERDRHWDQGGFPLTIIALRAYLSLLVGDVGQAVDLADRAAQELSARSSQGSTSDFAALCVARVKEATGQLDQARDILVSEWEAAGQQANLLTTITPDLVRLTFADRPEFAKNVLSSSMLRADRTTSLMDRLNVFASRAHIENNPALLHRAAELAERLGWEVQSIVFRVRAMRMSPEPAQETTQEALALVDRWDRIGAVTAAAQLNTEHAALIAAAPSKVTRRARSNAPQSSALSSALFSPPADALRDKLTQAERTVVHLVAEGLSNRDIAERLFVSHRTIETHVSHVLAKLNLTSRVQLARFVARSTAERSVSVETD